jgi:hypothetical protein
MKPEEGSIYAWYWLNILEKSQGCGVSRSPPQFSSVFNGLSARHRIEALAGNMHFRRLIRPHDGRKLRADHIPAYLSLRTYVPGQPRPRNGRHNS